MQKFTSLFYIHTYMHEAMSMKQIMHGNTVQLRIEELAPSLEAN